MKRSKSGQTSLDGTDRRIVAVLQRDASLSTQAVAERVGISASPCWRRIQRLKEAGILGPLTYRMDPNALNLRLTVFVAIRTGVHNADWLARFEAAVRSIPEIVAVHRLAGQIDYLLKVLVPGIEEYDAVYKRLTAEVDIAEVTSMISMETMRDTNELPVDYV